MWPSSWDWRRFIVGNVAGGGALHVVLSWAVAVPPYSMNDAARYVSTEIALTFGRVGTQVVTRLPRCLCSIPRSTRRRVCLS